MSDDLVVLLLSVGSAVAVLLGGALVLFASRGRSLPVTLAIATMTPVAAIVVGVMATAQQMFLSGHDFRVVLLVCVSAGLVALVSGIALARGVVADTRALRDTARMLSDDLAHAPGPLPHTPELAAVAAEMGAARERLDAARRREQSFDLARRELVAWVSHDLRTPLAGLRAMAESLEDGVAPDPARYHRQIRIQTDRLSTMVDDLFELSRIHSGTLALHPERVLLGDLVSDALSGTEALARTRGVRLSGEAAEAVVLDGDPAELSRVLTNLVVNAIRHTPADGTVHVRLHGSGEAVLTVEDQCGGIPEPDLERVFDVAWRGTHARTPGPDGGAGLGLAIVRGIVEAHRGSVSVTNVGAGCRFEVRLPLPA